MTKQRKKRALVPAYLSPNQLTLDGFETPFEKSLNPRNRWVVLAKLIPWDEVCNIYLKHIGVSTTGRPPINPRVVIGSVIIKHMCNLDDRETVDQISENVYMQYFLGYSSFINQAPFDASLFVEFRKRLGMEQINAINQRIMSLKANHGKPKVTIEEKSDEEDNGTPKAESEDDASPSDNKKQISETITVNKGRLLMDATACPQDIAYPTDLDLLSRSREKSEQLIDMLYDADLHRIKPRTYRRIARKRYLNTAQKKSKSRKAIRQAVGSQLRFLARNLRAIDKLLDAYDEIPLHHREYKYLLVINTVYQQQKQMYDNRIHQVDHRIISLHQPHVRPIVRGKSNAKVEFGSKINVSLINGISYLDEISWEAFNEGSHLMDYVQNFKNRFGYYPAEVLVDQIYCTRANRRALKLLGIRLIAKPLGRPPAVPIHVRPGERNPIEGKFGQAKTAYGLNRIRARLMGTSESMIASIILVLNLVNLAGVGVLCPIVNISRSFSAQLMHFIQLRHRLENCTQKVMINSSINFRLAA